MDMSHCNT